MRRNGCLNEAEVKWAHRAINVVRGVLAALANLPTPVEVQHIYLAGSRPVLGPEQFTWDMERIVAFLNHRTFKRQILLHFDHGVTVLLELLRNNLTAYSSGSPALSVSCCTDDFEAVAKFCAQRIEAHQAVQQRRRAWLDRFIEELAVNVRSIYLNQAAVDLDKRLIPIAQVDRDKLAHQEPPFALRAFNPGQEASVSAESRMGDSFYRISLKPTNTGYTVELRADNKVDTWLHELTKGEEVYDVDGHTSNPNGKANRAHYDQYSRQYRTVQFSPDADPVTAAAAFLRVDRELTALLIQAEHEAQHHDEKVERSQEIVTRLSPMLPIGCKVQPLSDPERCRFTFEIDTPLTETQILSLSTQILNLAAHLDRLLIVG